MANGIQFHHLPVFLSTSNVLVVFPFSGNTSKELYPSHFELGVLRLGRRRVGHFNDAVLSI